MRTIREHHRCELLLSILACFSMASLALQSQPYDWHIIAGSPGRHQTVDGTNTAARFSSPKGIAVDSREHLYVTEGGTVVREVTPIGTNWVVRTIATNFNQPAGLTVNTSGNVFVADYGSHRIVQLAPSGTNWVASTIASLEYGALPNGIVADPSGHLFLTDHWNLTLLSVAPVGTNWIVSTLAGSSGALDSQDGTNADGQFVCPEGITIDQLGRLFIAESCSDIIRRVDHQDTNWIVTTIAGYDGICAGVEGTNNEALFCGPTGIASDSSGCLFVADTGNKAIRKITPIGSDWVVMSVGPPFGTFNNIWGIATSPQGNLYFCDNFANTIWQGQQVIPTLQFQMVGTNLVLSWPLLTANFALESSGAVGPSAVWAPVIANLYTNGSNLVVTNPMPNSKSFYRLRKQ